MADGPVVLPRNGIAMNGERNGIDPKRTSGETKRLTHPQGSRGNDPPGKTSKLWSGSEATAGAAMTSIAGKEPSTWEAKFPLIRELVAY